MRDETEPASSAEITVEIVSAYVAHNQVAASDLPNVIRYRGWRVENWAADPQQTPDGYAE